MRAFLQNCAENYLQYLIASNQGYEILKIQTIHRDIFGFHLQLEAKLKSLESLILRSELGDFILQEDAEISILAYDEKTNALYLKIESELCDSLWLQKDSIKLISDLRFLVQNVIDFYTQEISLKLPTTSPDITPNFDILKDLPTQPNKEQLDALEGIFTHSFCYIWGVAGSGKTKVVLLHTLAFYLQSQQKVAILAPTNHALEQCLSTLIVHLKAIGVATKGILRLGTATQKFMESFPENCEQSIKHHNLNQNLMQSKILAMTLDTFLRRKDLQTMRFKHFFIDEAAFTPLIKVLPLCAFNQPITLLGDHKQLPPISMLSIKDSKNPLWQPSVFWKYSSLFLEVFFCAQESFKTPKKMPFISHCFALTQTYRYGENLAKLLDTHIYNNHLKGHNTQTHLYYLDTKEASNNKTSPQRTNITEATLCCNLAKDFIAKNLNFAILTPFVNQKQLILKTMPILFNEECVFTIHSAQGQEFDYVIFSPVTLHYHLNDSRNLNALFTLNVALSRPKKAMIIVCNRDYWLNLKGQFLSELIHIARPYTPNF